MATQIVTQGNASVQARKRLFSADEYERLAEVGILGEGDRVELIEGEITELAAAMGSRHAACVDRLNRSLSREIGDDGIVRVQSPIRLSDLTEPEPDLALLKPREDFYAGGHPAPEDVLLIVEVSETSVEYDTNVKLPLYASAGIPETWLVNLPAERVEVYSRPVDGEYREITRSRHEERISSRTVSGISASEILG
jgi:Uma2 family endonuclease